MAARKPITESINLGAFAPPEPITCCTCGQSEATHRISIQCRKNNERYDTRDQLYSVEYCVCGSCAKELVEVKLSAKLSFRR